MKNVFTLLTLSLVLALAGCGGDDNTVTDSGRPGTDGGGGGTDGGGGGTDGGGGGTDGGGGGTDGGGGGTDGGGDDTDGGGGDTDGGGGGDFEAFTACPSEDDYETGEDTIAFMGPAYNPACLQIDVGDMVTIPGSATHPRAPSVLSGTAGNPIIAGVTDQTVTFSAPGFYPYYCTVHGADNAAGPTGMAGVIWVQE
jgi:plastocyanin